MSPMRNGVEHCPSFRPGLLLHYSPAVAPVAFRVSFEVTR